MLQIMKDAWIRTLIAFDVRDPLKRIDRPYVFPEDLSELQPEARLRATICNLFGNFREPIEDIANTYEMTPNQVVSVLIEEGLIKDQRRNRVAPIKGFVRRVRMPEKGHPGPEVTVNCFFSPVSTANRKMLGRNARGRSLGRGQELSVGRPV
jgi:hypothetical protein